MLYLRRTREPRGNRHAKANGSFPLRLVGVRSGLRPTQTASGFPAAPPPAPLSLLSLSASCALRFCARFLSCLTLFEVTLRLLRRCFFCALGAFGRPRAHLTLVLLARAALSQSINFPVRDLPVA